ncbi:hypothetical protein M422DRAFT_226404 [Sphaerobolus stellatus SS14]|nr:hypothetical protein M422DRAFT_226404 [Sphaerobolus stellatus SS14]
MHLSDTLTISPTLDSDDLSYTVIFLHGLGQTIEQWIPFVKKLANQLPSITWILPQAPFGTITVEEDRVGPRWFDVYELPPSKTEDETDTAQASVVLLENILEKLIAEGMKPERILIAGFSQGSAMAMLTGLTFRYRLGGIGVLGGWLPPTLRKIVENAVPNLQYMRPPLFWAHGVEDKIIPLDIAQDTMTWLSGPLVGLTEDKAMWSQYESLGHEVDDRVMKDLVRWMRRL